MRRWKSLCVWICLLVFFALCKVLPEITARTASSLYSSPRERSLIKRAFPFLRKARFFPFFTSYSIWISCCINSSKFLGFVESIWSIAAQSISRSLCFFGNTVLFFRSRYGFGMMIDSPCSAHILSLSFWTARPDKKKSLNLRVQSKVVEL